MVDQLAGSDYSDWSRVTPRISKSHGGDPAAPVLSDLPFVVSVGIGKTLYGSKDLQSYALTVLGSTIRKP